MISNDLSHWPLVISVASGASTLSDHIAFLSDWTDWLGRGEAFATLRLFEDDQALVHPEGGARAAKAWLQANGERLKAQVLGMATVVPTEHVERMRRMNAEKLFGVPAGLFGEADAALDWVRPILANAGRPLDPDAVRATLASLRKTALIREASR